MVNKPSLKYRSYTKSTKIDGFEKKHVVTQLEMNSVDLFCIPTWKKEEY